VGRFGVCCSVCDGAWASLRQSRAAGVGHIFAVPASVAPCVTPCVGACFVVRFSFIDALGVGHILTFTVSDVTAVRLPPMRAFIARCASGDFWSSLAVGVGHIRTCALSFPGSFCRPSCDDLIPFPDFPSSAFGVSQEPEPLTLVSGANGGCGEHTPFRIEPERGKIGEDMVKPSGSNNVGDVLQHDELRSYVSDDPPGHRPEMPFVVKSTTSTGNGERLARETGSDEIHSSTPRCAVEGCEIVPDRSEIQPLLCHPRHDSGRRVGVPLNVSHGDGVDSGVAESEFEPSVTGAEV